MRSGRARIAGRWLAAWSCGLLALVAAVVAAAAEPELMVTVGGHVVKHTPGDLLGNPAATTITIPKDVAYKREMTYRAVPIAMLLGDVPRDATLRFSSSDGFAAMLPAAVLLTDGDGARAYLAIEPADANWPGLGGSGSSSAGPFYLVWLHPERARIVPEEWPYQVVRIEQMSSLAKRFPAIVPASGQAPDSAVNRGFAIFTRNCIVCHTINLGGDATIGPDLNVPYNPTEYLRADALRRLIRDPQSQRAWPSARMPAFDVSVISDHEYNDLLAYLRHMTNRKVAAPAAK